MFSAPFILKWAHEKDYDPKDIEPDLPRRLDLCYGLERKPNQLSFFTIHKPDGNLTIYPPGTYRVKVRVDSENASLVDKYFIVNFKGGWDQITIIVREAGNL